MSNQTFLIRFENNCYMVNVDLMKKASSAFRQFVELYNDDLSKMQLELVNAQYNQKTVEDFFNICQNMQSEINDSDIPVICELARIFKADQIYEKGAKFVRDNGFPRFNIPSDAFDSSKYLQIHFKKSKAHISDVDELDFDCSDVNENDLDNQNLLKYYYSKREATTVIYRITFEKPSMKCPRFYFAQNDNIIILSAKQNGSEIVVGRGPEVHLNSQKGNHIAKIVQHDDRTNTVYSQDQIFSMKYVYNSKLNNNSILTTFKNNGKKLYWSPREPLYDENKHKYRLKYGGSEKHIPVVSHINTVLENQDHKSTFIVRKMDHNIFEAECSVQLSPEIAFYIALAQIIGPYSNRNSSLENIRS